MFKWRSEKNKIKAVFKLQFHATQLKQLSGETLIISVTPADTGKPTRLEKAKVIDGNCYWEKPHYETVKFIHDPKDGKFHEKIYHFVLSTGSSKSRSLGEVSVDFACFAEATQISSVSLPLRNANCAALMHVSIQRVQESLDQREVDGNDSANRQDRSLMSQLSNGNIEETVKSNPTEDHGAMSENININRDHRGSSGSDITLSGSDSSSGFDTLLEPEPMNSKPTHEQHMSQWDWLDGSPPDLSTDDSSPSLEEAVLGEMPENGSPDAMIKKLKTELEVLARQVDVSELELQTVRKQIVKERKKGQDLSKKVDEINKERNAFREECEKLQAYKKCTEDTNVKVKVKVNNEGGDPWDLVDELRQELNYEKDLNTNLRLQLQKTQESNAELILAVQDLDAILEQKDLEKSKSTSSKPRESEEVKSETDDDEDQKALEDIVREHSGTQEAYLLEQKITDLFEEIELYKRDKNELEMQIDQISLDYESLNNQLKMKSEKLSESVLVIQELETYVKNLEKDLEDKAHGFELDIEHLINSKTEQEKRAICAEESLRKMKLQNANTAEKLHEEFKRLSTQMNSSFEANEKVVIKAMDEANQLRVEKRYLEEMLKKVKHDLDDFNGHYEEKLVDFLSQITQKSKQLEKMEKQIEDISSYKAEIVALKADKQNLEDERKELLELIDVNKQKDDAYERLQSEIERLKTRYSDIQLSLIEEETVKDEMIMQISQLKGDLKKKEDAVSSMEKKLKDSCNRVTVLEGSKVVSRNNPRNSKEITNLKNRIEILEEQIKLKETALKSSEDSFLEKENDLNHKIKELERRLEDLHLSTALSQASTADEMALLKKLNESMEIELMDMQERYSEISLKFAEVEGERQQLVMTLRNVKNKKKC